MNERGDEQRRESNAPLPGRPRLASMLWIVSAALMAYSAAIAVTGGIDFEVTGLRIRSRTWQRPAVLGFLCVACVAFTDRRRAAAATRHAAGHAARAWTTVAPGVPLGAVAAAAAAWALVAGTAFGTYAAGGADSSGYLNQAKLFSRGRVLDDGRLSARPPWPDALYKQSPLGYRPAPDGEHLAPTYPPGYPLMMAPAFFVHERAAYFIVPLCGALAVWLTFALGGRLGEPGAGAAAAALLSVSPTFLYQLVQPMSDVPATAAWLLALYVALGNRLHAGRGLNVDRDLRTPAYDEAALAGLVTGLAILIRPNLAPLACVVWAACAAASEPSSRWRRAAAVVLATAPAVVVLGVIQTVRYGSAFASGYGATRDLFGWTNVGPNLERYPRWMSETHTPLIALFVLAPLWIAWRQPARRMQFMLLWVFAVAVVVAYMPYVYFQTFEWTYTRFLLPAIPIMWILVLLPVTDWLRRIQPGLGTLALALASSIVIIFSIRVARDRSVFDLGRGELKYPFAAEHVRGLRSNSIVISMQHSGSLWYYTTQPVLRWDHLEPRRLDETIDWLTAAGYVPLLVADREELDRIKARFVPADQRALDRIRLLAQSEDTAIYGFE